MLTFAVIGFALKVAAIALACRYLDIFDRQSAVIFALGAGIAYLLSAGIDATEMIIAFTMGFYVMHLLVIAFIDGRIGIRSVFSRANLSRYARLFMSMVVALLFVMEVFRVIDFSGAENMIMHYIVSIGIISMAYIVPENIRKNKIVAFFDARILGSLAFLYMVVFMGSAEMTGIFYRAGIVAAIFVLYDAIYESFTRDVAVRDVFQGMTIAEVVIRKGKSYYTRKFPFIRPTSIIRSRLRHKAAGEEVVFWPFRRLGVKDIEVLRNIMSTYGIDKIRVQNTADFRPYVLFGSLAAVVMLL